MVVAAVVSAWTVMAFMVLDEKLASTDSDEACEGVILLLIAAAGIGVATGMVPMSGAVVAAASIAAPLSWLWFIARLTTWCVRENGVNTWWTILAAVTVTAGTARFELLSDQLHHYYRKRLLGAFYHRSEDLSLREVDCTRSPFLLCNTVMNDFVRHPGESRCAPFVMTPLFCGSQRTGFCTTPDTLTTSEVMAVSGGECGYRRACVLPLRCITEQQRVCVHAGAVALAMGNADASGKLRFLLGLFGISLGRWFPLQSRDDAARRGAPSSWTVLLVVGGLLALAAAVPVCLLPVVALAACTAAASLLPSFRWLLHASALRHFHQALGVVHVGPPPPYVYLSDGGHLDNLGVLELLKRRCSHVSDGWMLAG